jgi:hypothetical protein
MNQLLLYPKYIYEFPFPFKKYMTHRLLQSSFQLSFDSVNKLWQQLQLLTIMAVPPWHSLFCYLF